MADDLDPVELEFITDAEDAALEVRELSDAADELAEHSAEASAAVDELRGATQDLTDADYDATGSAQELQEGLDGVRDSAQEAKETLDGVRDESEEAGEALGHVRDEAEEAAEGLRTYRDEAGRLRDETGRFVTESEVAGEALGHVRDEAVEAAAAVHELGDSAESAARKLDLMELSGLGLFTSLGPLLGIIGAIVIACAAIAPAAVAAGLGLGAFAGFAAPTVMKVFGALKDTHAELMKLPVAERDVVEGIKGLEGEFFKLADSIRPEVFGLLEQGLQIARTLLPEVIPLVQQGAIAFHNMLSGISAGLNSSGFIGFLHTMTALVVPATAAIGHLAGAVLGLLGHALTSLAPLSVPFIGALTGIIRALSGPVVTALHVVIGMFDGLYRALAPLLPGLSRIADAILNDLGSSFSAFLPILSQVVRVIATSLLGVLNQLLPVVENMLTPNDAFMKSLQGIANVITAVVPPLAHFLELLLTPGVVQFAVYVLTAVVAFKALVGVINLAKDAMALFDVIADANPVALIVIAIVALAAAFYLLWEHCAAFRKFWEDLWRDVTRIFDDALRWLEEHWKLLPAFLLGPLGILVTEVLLHWARIESIFRDAWSHIRGIVMPAIDLIVGYIRDNLTLIEGIFRSAFDVIESVFEAAWDLLKGTAEIALDFIVSTIREAFTLAEGIFEIFVDLLEGHWSAAWHELLATGKALLGEIVGMIRSGVADFGSMLFNAGAALVSGLLHGIESMFGAVGSVVGSLAHKVAGFFGLSPAIEGPLSGGGAPYIRGLHFAMDIADGILAGHAQVAAAVRQVANTAGLVDAVTGGGSLALGGGGYGAAGAAGAVAGGGVHVTVPLTVSGGAMNAQALQQLQVFIQQAITEYFSRNSGLGLIPYGRPGWRG